MAAQLRLYQGGDDDPIEAEKAASIARRPELAWRMREFFESWFAPRYLKSKAAETTRNYYSTIRYWESITDDWRLVDLAYDRDGADGQALDFTEQLPEWGYSRRGIRRGSQIRIGRLADNPQFTPLSAVTGREHASRMANLFRKAGPERDNRRRYAELLPRAPIVEVIAAAFEEKSPFCWEHARAIAAATGQMRRPLCPAWLPTSLWWQVRLALLFYTGLRMGTIVKLAWPHISDLCGDDPWLKVPAEIVKTRKAIKLPLHGQLAGLLQQVQRLRPSGCTETLLIPEACGRRTFLDYHAELQQLAGIRSEHRQSPHVWRRTHLAQIHHLGAGRGNEAAQVAADHADGRTTVQHYLAAVVNSFRLRLPLLFD